MTASNASGTRFPWRFLLAAAVIAVVPAVMPLFFRDDGRIEVTAPAAAPGASSLPEADPPARPVPSLPAPETPAHLAPAPDAPPVPRDPPAPPADAEGPAVRLIPPDGVSWGRESFPATLFVNGRAADGSWRVLASATLAGDEALPLPPSRDESFRPAERRVVLKLDDGRRFWGALPGPGEDGVGDIELQPFLAARGTVLDGQGRPAAGARVYLYAPETAPGEDAASSWVETAVCDAAGAFRFDERMAESPLAFFAAADGPELSPPLFAAPLADADAGPVLTLLPADLLLGEVEEADGSPAAGLVLFVESFPSGHRFRLVADRGGAFATAAPRGPARIWPEGPGRAKPAWTVEVPCAATLRLPQRGVLRVQARDAGTLQPIAGFGLTVDLLLPAGGAARIVGADQELAYAPDEACEVPGLLPGLYRVRVRAGDGREGASEEVPLAAGETRLVVVDLE